MKKLSVVLLLTAALCALPSPAAAHEYDRDDSDMWIRYLAYALHPIGIALEYGVTRPIHWLVSSSPNRSIIFGHKVTEDINYDYFEWR